MQQIASLFRFMLILNLIGISPSLLAKPVKKNFTYKGQPSEKVSIDQIIDLPKTRTETYTDTCYRQEPYEDRECGDETYYRNECYTVPARTDCSTVYDRQCTPTTRYEEQCTDGPSRRVCSTGPDREECSTGPSRRVCNDVPSKRVCKTRPTKRVCKTNPRTGKEFCTTVGGGESCTNVGGGRKCHTVEGRRTCRTVPGTESCSWVTGDPICRTVSVPDEDCTDIPRQVCEDIPSYEECDSIPYTKWECHDVTKYKDVPYECEKTREVPYTVKYQQNVNVLVEFEGKDWKNNYQFMVNFDGKENITLDVKDEFKDRMLILMDEGKNVDKDDKGVTIDQRYRVEFIHQDQIPFRKGSKFKFKYLKKDGKLKYILKKAKNADKIELSLKLTSPDNKDELLISSLLKHKNIKIQQKNNKMIIEMDLKKFGLKNDLNTNHRYHLEIQHRFAHPGKKALGFFKDKMILKVKKDNIKP